MRFSKSFCDLHYWNKGIIDETKYSYGVIARVYSSIPWRRMIDVQRTLYEWLKSIP
jgi:hypothetical protein